MKILYACSEDRLSSTLNETMPEDDNIIMVRLSPKDAHSAYQRLSELCDKFHPNVIISEGSCCYYAKMIGGPIKILINPELNYIDPTDRYRCALNAKYDTTFDLDYWNETYLVQSQATSEGYKQHICDISNPVTPDEFREVLVPIIDKIINTDDGITFSDMEIDI